MTGPKRPQQRILLPVTEEANLQPSFDCIIKTYPRQSPQTRASLSKANLLMHVLSVNMARLDS